MKWYQSKFMEAAAIALFVGVVSGLSVFFVAFPEAIAWQKMVSLVGIAFLAPFAALSRALPDPAKIVNPQSNVENVQNMTVNTESAPADPPTDGSPHAGGRPAVATKPRAVPK